MFGVLAIDKPAGMTSRGVVNRIERLIKPVRVGHTGTLDPMATGVLLLAIGSATRLVEFSHLQSKSYEAEFWLGHTSESLDTEGPVSKIEGGAAVTREQLAAALPGWLGSIEQTPPKFSAVHVAGERAYDLARQGRDFELPSRRIEIHQLELLDFDGSRFTLRVDCGTGTYIRSLGSDIARQLGSDAVMSRLVRTRIGELELSDCARLDEVLDREGVAARLHPPNCLVASLPSIQLDAADAAQIRHGIPLQLASNESGPLAAVDSQGQLVAILQRSGESYRSLRVFQKASETPQPSNSSTPHKPES